MVSVTCRKSHVRLQANMLAEAVARPPLKSPLEGALTIDHRWGVPSQTIGPGTNPDPDMVAIRPTDWLRLPYTNASAPWLQDAVPLIVAAPDFESKLPVGSTVRT